MEAQTIEDRTTAAAVRAAAVVPCDLCGKAQGELWHCDRCPASLCETCDAEVHLNRIAQKHERRRLQVRGKQRGERGTNAGLGPPVPRAAF
jgi:hypothetical protein